MGKGTLKYQPDRNWTNGENEETQSQFLEKINEIDKLISKKERKCKLPTSEIV